MMKGMFKRALAGVAAAALAATGLALGAGAANAAPDTEATIQVHNAQPGHTYTAYRFATFGEPTRGEDLNVYVDIDTVDGWDGILSNGLESIGFWVDSDNSVYENNPAAGIATLTPEKLRLFADALDDTAIAVGMDPVDSYTVESEDPEDITLDGEPNGSLTEGWYIIIDSTTTEEGATEYHPIAIVATDITPYVDGVDTVTVNPGDGQLNITGLGVVNAKTDDDTKPDTPPEKDAYINDVKVDVDDPSNTDTGSANIGDTVDFTVTDTIPADADAYEKYTFTFNDQATQGLDIDEQSLQIVVDTDDDEDFTDETALATADYSVLINNAADGTSDGSAPTTIVVEVNNVSGKRWAGKKIQLQYSATVTTAAEGYVQNNATVSHNGGTVSDPDSVKLNNATFQFKKVNKEDKGLKDVKFSVYDGTIEPDEAALTFAVESDGHYVKSNNGVTELETGEDGMLVVRGLKDGTYTVKETSNPDAQYAENYYAEFTVTIMNGEAVVNADDENGLVTPSGEGTIATVLNVRGVTELPLTGAAGTALFTVLGVLIAGAGALVYMKSRNVKHALRG